MTKGVDVKKEALASQLMYEAAKHTWKNREGKIGEIQQGDGAFSSGRYIPVGLLRNILAYPTTDGIGTKVEIAERMGDYSTLAYDLFANVVDDGIRRGGEPAFLTTDLNVNHLHMPSIEQLARGVVDAAEDAGIAVMDGETAVLGDRVRGYGDGMCLSWSASCMNFVEWNRVLSAQLIEPGQSIVAVKESSFRSNGYTLARGIVENSFGEDWHRDHDYIGSWLLAPSTIYCRALVDILGAVRNTPKATITGIANISGGGIPEKLGRMLPHCGAELTNLFPPWGPMVTLQSLGKLSDDRAYTNWNMGNGLLITTPEPQAVISHLKNYGHEAKVAGVVTNERRISLISQGAHAYSKTLVVRES